MYYVDHPDGRHTEHWHWEDVAPLLFDYNVPAAKENCELLCPEGIAAQVKRWGGSPWQANEFDCYDGAGNYVGCLAIEGQEGMESQ